MVHQQSSVGRPGSDVLGRVLRKPTVSCCKAANSHVFVVYDGRVANGLYGPKVTEWGSSRRVNDFQTLDIHHYFVFERPVRGAYLNMKCVPMNVRPSELADLSSLPIDLVPRLWSKRLHVINELAGHLSKLESTYMAKRVLGTEDSGAAVAGAKVFMVDATIETARTQSAGFTFAGE